MNSRNIEMSISLVIPTFNEERTIENNLISLDKILRESFIDYEIIVVNDCSTDKTSQILDKLSSRFNKIKITQNLTNKGLGRAIRTGFQEASKELIFYTDADMPFEYAEIPKAVQFLFSHASDIVTGYRLNRQSESWLRFFCSLAYNYLIRFCFSLKIRDINFAFKLIRRDKLKILGLKSDTSFIDAEMLAKAAYLGYKIDQVPVNYLLRKNGRSRLFKFPIIFKSLIDLLKYYKQIKKFSHGKRKKPLRWFTS